MLGPGAQLDLQMHCFLHQVHLQQVLLGHLPQAHQVQANHFGYQGIAVPVVHLQVLGMQVNYALVSLWEVMDYKIHHHHL